MRALLIFLFSLVIPFASAFSQEERPHHPEGMGIHHDFSDAEAWAKRFNDPARDKWQKPEEVVNIMDLRPGMAIADIGAGTGYFLPYLHKSVAPNGIVLALDIEKNLVHFMRKRAKEENWTTVEAQVIHPTDPALAKSKMDRVLIVNTWHHIENRVEYAGKLKKALKKDGALFIVDYVPGAEGPGPAQKHRIKPEKIKEELASAGFETVTLDETLPYQYIVVGR